MSKRFHICKTVLNDIIYCAGDGTYKGSFGNTAATVYGATITTDPNLVQLYPLDVNNIIEATTDENLSYIRLFKATSIKSSRLYDLGIQLHNNSTKASLQASEYYKQGLINNTTLTWEISVNYSDSSSTETYKIYISDIGSNFSNGSEDIILTTQSSFDNIRNNKPLTSVSVDTTQPPVISTTDGTTLTTIQAVTIVSEVRNIVVLDITGHGMKADTTTPTLFKISKPLENNYGRLFVKNFKVKELPLNPLYSYKGLINSTTQITHKTEPSASNYTTNASELSIGGLLQGANTKVLLENNLVHSYDDVSSSYDSNYIYTYDYRDLDDINSWSSFSTGCSWNVLKIIAWYDGVLIRTNATRQWQDYPLIDAILTGIAVHATMTEIDIQIIVPNFAFLGGDNITNNPTYPIDYLGGFCPYNHLKLQLEIGYQTESFVSGSNNNPGVYIDTNKVRRLFIGTKEVKSIVIDAEE